MTKTDLVRGGTKRARALASICGIAVVALATAAGAVPVMKNRIEIAKLRAMLEDNAITCPRVVTAWYLAPPSDNPDAARGWKVACSNGQEYGILKVGRKDPTILPWDEMADLLMKSGAR